MAALIRNDGKMLVLLLYVFLLFVHKHCLMQQMSFVISKSRQWLMLVSQGIHYIEVDFNGVGKHLRLFSWVHKVFNNFTRV